MNVLTKLASENSSRLEKIASAVAAIEEGYNPEEVVAFAAEQGIDPNEIVLGANLFATDLDKEASEENELQKIASVIQDENAVPLVKVAAAVDLFAAGAIDADEAYNLAGQLGFDQQDVDYIFTSAYPELAKEASAAEAGEKAGKSVWDTVKELASKAGTGVKNAATAKDVREGLQIGVKGEKGEKDYLKALKGAAKTGTLYGTPAAAAAYLMTKDNKDSQK